MSLLVLTVGTTFAQTDTIPRTESRLFKGRVLLPGLAYEKALGSSTTFDISVYASPGYSSSVGFTVYPNARADLRKYYNFLRRYAKGKRTKGNSANFVGFSVFMYGNSIDDDSLFEPNYGISPMWGLQRTYGSKLNLEFSGGPLYVNNLSGDFFEDGIFTVSLNFRVGWVLSRQSFR